MAKCLFVVELDLPPGMTQMQMCYIIQRAVQGEPGIHHPDEPIFNLKRNSVKVKSYAKVVRAMRSRKLSSGV